ncbi:MAG: GntR family transcriptional regulator [Lactobacillus sp.]|nr:GntR family transcriptional regulator [Lactobacillus sp.]
MSEVLYQKIREDLKAKITQGFYSQGSKLPSETKLQAYYQVSRVTLRNAVDGLVKEGFIERVQGKGSFIRKPHKVNRLIRESSVESFTKVAHANGLEPSFEILKIDQVNCPKQFQGKIGKSIMLYIQRLCKVDGEPIMWENNYYVLPRFEQLSNYNLEGSIYSILQKHFGIKNLYSDDTTLSMSPSNLKNSKILNRTIGFPLFKLETIVRDENKDIVHAGIQYIVSDRYQFKI